MATKKKTPIIIRASAGMYLTNGIAYGKTVALGATDSAENWHEITEAEYNEICASAEDEPAQ